VIRSIAALLFVIGCGGDCIPKEAATPASFAVNSAASDDMHVVHSADELRAAIGNANISFPPLQGHAAAIPDPATTEADARKALDDFIAATTFATTDVALVRAGDERAMLRGSTTRADATTLYFTGVCSTCAGGNPASYYDAAAAENAARAKRTMLVRVPKGSRVVVAQCSTECGTCPTNVP